MEEKSEKKWYVVKVQSGKEDQIKEALDQRVKSMGMEEKISQVLVPVERVSEIKGGKKTVRKRKIFPGYIMIEMELSDESFILVRETTGIGDFVGSKRSPIPMSENEVEEVLSKTQKKDEEPEVKIDFSKGDSVKIKEGPFENFDGVVEEVYPGKGAVKVIVTIFGRATPVDLEYWQIESI